MTVRAQDSDVLRAVVCRVAVDVMELRDNLG